MRHLLSKKSLSKLLVLLAVIALLVTLNIGIGASTAHANARWTPHPTDTSNCKRIHTQTYSVFCIGPMSQSLSCDPNHPNQMQYFTATDGHGKPIDWTYTDELNHCVTVSYNIPGGNLDCTIEMYIPNAFADANFTYTWQDGQDGVYNNATFNQAPVDGWQTLFSASNVTNLTFIDLQSQGSQHLGWGSNASDGLRVTCG